MMPLPPVIIEIKLTSEWSTFLVPAYPDYPGKLAVK